MSSLLSKSYPRKAETPELWFLMKGVQAHEFYLVTAGALRPIRAGFVLVGQLHDDEEADDFIAFCEGSNFSKKLNIAHVRYSWANWRRYHRPRGAHRNNARH